LTVVHWKVETVTDPRQELARRLKALRDEHWPNHGVTQLQLAEALGGKKPLSVSLISSWENQAKPVTPPMPRLASYAAFFATLRTIEQEPARLVPVSQMTAEERAGRDRLLSELTDLRAAAMRSPDRTVNVELAKSGLWRFPPEENVTIVCAQLPAELREGFMYADPASPDYVELYTYADLDALIELYGHIRAFNPDAQVHFRTAQELLPDDYTTHLVLLGGVDWNVVTRALLDRVELPVRQVARHAESQLGGFEVKSEKRSQLFVPELDDSGQLIADVAHFYRSLNPFNAKRTVTICNGMYGRGTLGAVRALTDARFRDRNEAYVRQRFAGAETFSIIVRVSVLMGQLLTPDWTVPETRLHEWPESAS
jgi:transcriptional regulator with XRE-family HTH domain